MKKFFTLIIVALFAVNYGYSQTCSNITWETNPNPVVAYSSATLTVTLDCSDITWTTGDLYLWMWVENGDADINCPTNGTWTASDPSMQMTDNGNGTYSFTFTPTTLFATTADQIPAIGFLVKALDGTGDNKTPDQLIEGVVTNINNINESISITPNPSTGLFQVNADKNYSLEVVDITGKVVLTQEINNQSNVVDLTSCNSGMYFFYMNSGEAKKVYKVIVK